MERRNAFREEDLAAVLCSATPDLTAAFPAAAVRLLGWDTTPLFGTAEIEQPESVKKCVRVLALWNTDKPAKDVEHVYLREEVALRPDMAGKKGE
jgi:chorismate mutase